MVSHKKLFIITIKIYHDFFSVYTDTVNIEEVIIQLGNNRQVLQQIQDSVMVNIMQILIQIENNVQIDNEVLVQIQNIIQVNVVNVLIRIQNNIQINNQILVQIQNIVQNNGNTIVQFQNSINVLNANIGNQLFAIFEKLCDIHETWPWLPKHNTTCPSDKKC